MVHSIASHPSIWRFLLESWLQLPFGCVDNQELFKWDDRIDPVLTREMTEIC
jgi:hypothetical protein